MAESGHPGSEKVRTNFLVQSWLKSPDGVQVKPSTSKTSLDGEFIPKLDVSAILEAFINTHASNFFSVYAELPRIYSNEEALMHAEGIIDKVTWLSINMMAMDKIMFKNDKADKRATRTTDPRVVTSYMSAYLALVNFWFGWKHAGFTGNPKTKYFSSIRDPIALLRGGTLLYLAMHVDQSQIVNESEIVMPPTENMKSRIIAVFRRLREINDIMKNVIKHPSATDEVASLLYKPTVYEQIKTHNKDLTKINVEIQKAQEDLGKLSGKKPSADVITAKQGEIIKLHKKQSKISKQIEGLISGYQTQIKSVDGLYGIFVQNGGPQLVRQNAAKVYENLALPRIMLLAVVRQLSDTTIDVNAVLASEDSTTTSNVLKWIEQNIAWAWGGVMNNFDREVIMNSPDGVGILSMDTMFLHISRTFVGMSSAPSSSTTHIALSKLAQNRKLNIAWTPNYETMRVWCKEIWPNAFIKDNPFPSFELSGSLVRIINDPEFITELKKLEGNQIAPYGTALRSITHPEFGAVFVSVMFEEDEEKGSGAIKFLQYARDLFNNAWETLNGAGNLFICVPHGACSRTMTMSVKNIKGAVGSVLSGKCGNQTYIEYASNLFTYDDEMRLPKSIATLSDMLEDLTKELQKCKSDPQAAELRARLKVCSDDLKKAISERNENAAKLKECNTKLGEQSTIALEEQVKQVKSLELELDDQIKKTAEGIDAAKKKADETCKRIADATKVEAEKHAKQLATYQNIAKILGIGSVEEATEKQKKLAAADAAIAHAAEVDQKLAQMQASIAMEREQCDKETSACASTIADSHKKARDCEAKLAEIQKDLVSAQQYTKRMEEQMKIAQDASRSVIESTAMEVVDLKAASDILKAKLQNEEAIKKAMEREIAELKASKTEKGACDAVYKAELTTVELKHKEALEKAETEYKQKIIKAEADCDKKVAIAEAETAKSQKETEKASADLAAALATAQQVKSENDALKEKTKALEESHKKQADEAVLMEAKIAGATAKITTTEVESRDAADKLAETKTKLIEAQNALAMSRLETEQAKEAAQRLEGSCAASDADRARLNTEVQRITAEAEEKITQLTMAHEHESNQLAAQNARIADLMNENSGLVNQITLLRIEIDDLNAQIAAMSSGALVLPPIVPLGTPYSGSVSSTSMPAAMVNMVDTPPGTPLKTSDRMVEAMALGTACGTADKKAEGCVINAITTSPCQLPDQVIRAVCDYSTIPVPTDLRDVALTYSVLDPGSKVHLQLQRARLLVKRAGPFIIYNSKTVLSRTLTPLGKIYEYNEITPDLMVNMLHISNVQYARYLDADVGLACRQVFETLYGTSNSSLSAEKLKSIGLELLPGPNTTYKVTNGPFAQIYGKKPGDLVNPVQHLVHFAYRPDAPSGSFNTYKYSKRRGGYALPYRQGSESIAEAKRDMALAIRHLSNAAATYIYESAYDEKTIMIPGTNKIPAGAFAMLPRADVSAVLAAAILYPRSSTSSRNPDFSSSISEYDKDPQGSVNSLLCAAGMEILENYCFEIERDGDVFFESKVNPANLGTVMAEAAKRVAEIARLVEAIK